MAAEIDSAFNPIGWVQFRLNGGMKRLIPLVCIYAGAMAFFNVLFFRGSGEYLTLSRFAAGSLTLTIVISAILIILVGAGAINKTILRDFSSDMITSHRSTAMSGRMAVVGYLTGPTATIFGLTVVNWFACTVLAQLAGLSWYAPSFLFVALACLALVAWTGSVLAGLSYRGKLSFAALLMPLSFLAFIPPLAEFLTAHPGLALLLNYNVIYNMSSAATSSISPDAAKSIVISMLFQVVLALTFFIAASRRYLRDDVPAFTQPLAFALVALCTLACAIGLTLPNSVTIRIQSKMADVSTQVLATIISLALVALLPVANAARSAVQWSKRRKNDTAFTAPRPRGTWETAVAATIVVFGILAVVNQTSMVDALDTGNVPLKQAMGYLVASFLLALLTFGGALRFSYAYVQSAAWVLLILLIATWALPLVGDLTLEYANERQANAPKSIMFSSSPLGMWILLMKNMPGPLVPGIIVQAVIAAAAQIVSRRAKY